LRGRLARASGGGSARRARLVGVLRARTADELAIATDACSVYQLRNVVSWRFARAIQSEDLPELFAVLLKEDIRSSDPRLERLERICVRAGCTRREARAVAVLAAWVEDPSYVYSSLVDKKHPQRLSRSVFDSFIAESDACRERLDETWRSFFV
jgi:hypothetical protein